MEIIFTSHAEYRLRRRALLPEEVIEAIKLPDKIIKKYGKYYYQKKLQRGTIEIVCERTGKGLNVITIDWL